MSSLTLYKGIRLHEKPFLGTIVACLDPDPLNNFNPDLMRIRNTDFLIGKQTERPMGSGMRICLTQFHYILSFVSAVLSVTDPERNYFLCKHKFF